MSFLSINTNITSLPIKNKIQEIPYIASWFLNNGVANLTGSWVDVMPWNTSFFLSTGSATLTGLWDDTQAWA